MTTPKPTPTPKPRHHPEAGPVWFRDRGGGRRTYRTAAEAADVLGLLRRVPEEDVRLGVVVLVLLVSRRVAVVGCHGGLTVGGFFFGGSRG